LKAYNSIQCIDQVTILSINLFTNSSDFEIKISCVNYLLAVKELKIDQILALEKALQNSIKCLRSPYLLLKKMIQLISRLILMDSDNSNNLLSLLLHLSKQWLCQDCPLALRMEIVKGIVIVIPKLQNRLNIMFIDYFFILDSLLIDEDISVRDASASCVSSLLDREVYFNLL
jgi:hypothetical protein